jgi:transcriptional regulator with XRE-family HTH domain
MDMSAIDAAIGERVHTLMWRVKVPQTELAAELGIDQSALSRRLRGRTSWKATELLYIAERLNVTLESLLPSREEIAALIERTPAAVGDKPRAVFECTPAVHGRLAVGGVPRQGRRRAIAPEVPGHFGRGRAHDARIARKRTRISAIRTRQFWVDVA